MNFFVDLRMLLQLENTTQENLNKLLAFAQENKLQLSIVDDSSSDYTLPGKPLTDQQLSSLIKKSRNSGVISMADAHQIARNNFNAD